MSQNSVPAHGWRDRVTWEAVAWGGLILVVGAFAAVETQRTIEDAARHRYEMRSRFSEVSRSVSASTLG